MNKAKLNAGQILQRRRETLRMTQAELADAAGVSPSMIIKIEGNWQSIMSAKVENFYGILRALQWTVGELEQELGLSIQYDGGDMKVSQPDDSYILLPVRDLASAGKPVVPSEMESHDYYPVLNQDYRRGIELYAASGDSMTTADPKSIQSGDILFVDSTDLNLRDGQIYVIQIPGDGITVKRARKLGNKYWLFSDNPVYPPFQPNEATVLGRVIRWYHIVNAE